jgi:hypothetical protein
VVVCTTNGNGSFRMSRRWDADEPAAQAEPPPVGGIFKLGAPPRRCHASSSRLPPVDSRTGGVVGRQSPGGGDRVETRESEGGAGGAEWRLGSRGLGRRRQCCTRDGCAAVGGTAEEVGRWPRVPTTRARRGMVGGWEIGFGGAVVCGALLEPLEAGLRGSVGQVWAECLCG